MAKETNINPLLLRYKHNSRALFHSELPTMELSPETDSLDVGVSVTDKETYRLSMASKRGALGSIGKFGDFSSSNAYMFPDGKYDSTKDFSILLRKDLSIVELDEIISDLTKRQESADEDLKAEIQEQLNLANTMKEEKASEETNSSGSAE